MTDTEHLPDPEFCTAMTYPGRQDAPPEYCENEAVPGEDLCEYHLPDDDYDDFNALYEEDIEVWEPWT